MYAVMYAVRTRPLARAVLVEVAIADCHRRSWRTAHDTILIVDKFDLVDCQIALVEANAGTVIVGYAGPRQGQVPHRRVITLYDKKSFPHAGLVGDDDTETSALDYQVIGIPHRAIEILPRLDFDTIAVFGDRRRCRRRLVGLIGTDFERLVMPADRIGGPGQG